MRYRIIGRIPPGTVLFHGEWKRYVEPVEPYETEEVPEGTGWVFTLVEDPVSSDGEKP